MEERTWWKESVVYQIYPRSFNDSNADGLGDLNGITEKLDYLANLGVDILWISPFYDSPNRDMGYDISDYRAILKEFGTMEDFDRMLSTAHEKGIKIMIDLVINHSSDLHAWFQESKSSKDNPKRDYYIWRKGKDGLPPNNWGSHFSGSAWEKDEASDEYYLHLFAKEQPDLNWNNKELRTELYDMMRFWCDKGIDGFRMDVINLIAKDPDFPDYPLNSVGLYGDAPSCVPNGAMVHTYLKEMNQEVLSKYSLATVGETPQVSPEDACSYAGFDENEINMVFQFEHMGIDGGPYGRWCEPKICLPKLKEILSRWQNGLEGRAWNSLYWGNHDQPRIVSRWGNDTEEYRVISAKLFAICLHFMKGTPFIYQGEELGMTNNTLPSMKDVRDIEILNAYHELVEELKVYTPEEFLHLANCSGRDNARTPMQWSADENTGFTTGTPWIGVNKNYTHINAQAALADTNSVFYTYQKLLKLRKELLVMVYGRYDLLETSDDIYAYTRTLDQEVITVVCNFTDKAVAMPEGISCAGQTVLISNYDEISETELQPYQATAFLKK